MPHVWNNILVVTKEELIPTFWANYNALKVELYRYKDKPYGIKRAQVGGNGRKLLIDFDSLPKEVQTGLGDPRALNHILERYYAIDPEAVDFYHDWQFPNGNYLTPQTQEQYITNASVIKAALALQTARVNERTSKGHSTRSVLASICTDVQSFNPVLKAKFNTEHNLPATYRHFKTVIKRFQDKGYIGIIKDRKGKRQSNALKLTEATEELLNNLFGTLSTKPTPTQIAVDYQAFKDGSIDVVNKVTAEVYNPENFPELSESTISKFLASWRSTAGTHNKRSGDRQKLVQKFEPYHSFEKPTFAGSIISVDDRQPPFEYAKGKRMWFYNGIDLASEAFTCWVYGKTKEGIILEFYRQMVRNYHEWGFNLPAEIEAESSLNSSYTDTFLKDGNMFQHVNIYANKARSKRIEGYYRPLRYQLEKEREGWLARPFALSEPNQQSTAKKITVPYDLLKDECLIDIMTWNNMEHSTIKGKTRWEVFTESQNPNLKPTNYKAILPHLGYKTETSCNAGIIRLQSREWLLGDKGEIYTGEALIRLMKQVETKDINIYWLDGNDGRPIKALVFMGGRYICEALPKPRYNKARIEQTTEDLEARSLMTRYAATVQTYMKLEKNKLEPVTIIDRRKKTLNDKFIIPGLKKNEPRTTPVETLDDRPEEEIVIPQKKAAGSSWDDRFKI